MMIDGMGKWWIFDQNTRFSAQDVVRIAKNCHEYIECVV
jgi:hypothetical protein